MKMTKTVLAITSALFLGTAMAADGEQQGVLADIDTESDTVIVEQGATNTEFNLDDMSILEALKEGDAITFTLTDGVITNAKKI